MKRLLRHFSFAVFIIPVVCVMALLSMGCSPPTSDPDRDEEVESMTSTSIASPIIEASISTFSRQTIVPGGATLPINFSISHSDSSIDLESLIVEAKSDNPTLISSENIEIDVSNPSQCSIVARHEGNQTGSARIKVIVRDRPGVSSSASFHVSVRVDSTN